MNTVFIHTNNKQLLGAKVAKFAIEKHLKNSDTIAVKYLNVDELPAFKRFSGKTFLRMGEGRVFDPKDLQSFTLSRFMPPQEMGFAGRAIVIDPDIFALTDITELFAFDMQGKAIAACRKKDAWDTSVMLMDCSQLTHWNMEKLLERLADKKLDYADLMTLKGENQNTIIELPRIWNNLDTLTPETKMIHMTGRLTQPWKTGLPIDFTRNKMPRLFGIIPREWVHKLLGKYNTHYQQHPNNTIEDLFFSLARQAFDAGIVTKEDIEREIQQKHVRPDFMKMLDTV